jgi:sporulation protein YlmC with PRC-barrel domain
MDMRVNANVECSDGPCGEFTQVIIDPKDDRVTHLAVKEKQVPFTQHLVPVEQVQDSSEQVVHLRCDGDSLSHMANYIDTEYIPTGIPSLSSGYTMWTIPEALVVPVEHRHVPAVEFAFDRGAQVRAIDGQVGHADEFVIDQANGRITHLVLREGHWWGQKDVTIPVTQISHIEENTIFLRLDKREIEQLPSVPVRHSALTRH